MRFITPTSLRKAMLTAWKFTTPPSSKKLPKACMEIGSSTENIYGVDLDEQAVEVTRLNLMLRAAIERDKLPLLTHIQHGNSLIDDPTIAGNTAFKWEERFPSVFAGRERALWFVTFVTHNSRVSERMVTFGVQAGNPVVFGPEEQIQVAELIAEACRKYAVPVVAWNVLPDHVHMIIGAEDDATLTEY